MVGPISEAERSAFNRRVVYGTTLLVGLSAGLITLRIETTPVQTVGAVALGLLVGYPLAKYVVPTGRAPADRQRQRIERDNPFTDGGDSDGEDDSGNGSRRSDDYGRR